MKHTLLIYFLMVGTIFAGSQQESLMPVGFDQVHIGMDWRSLVDLRPNAEIMNMMPNPSVDLKPNPKEPKGGLVERLTSGPFDRVMYAFEKGVLVAVMFGKEESNDSSSEREKLIRTVAKDRGMPVRIEMVGNRRDQGVLTWQDHALQVNVIAPVDDAKSKKGVLGLQIMNRKYAERIKAIGVSDDVRKGKELQDKDRVDAFKTEIQKLLSMSGNTPEEE
ncbi:hypothetical protein ACFLQL_01190 [Verrucomicrobiota bacterium]